MKSILGISSSSISINGSDRTKLNFETNSLFSEGQKKYDEVILISSQHAIFQYNEKEKQPEIFFSDRNISHLKTLIVRGTSRFETPISILANSLDACGCDLVDPVERFTGTKASKILSSIDRFKRKVGIETYFLLSSESTSFFIKKEDIKNKFPILVKPVSGSGGRGIFKLNNSHELIKYSENFFNKENKNQILMLQPFINFQTEYRAMMTKGVCLGIAKKEKTLGSITANARQGSIFIGCDEEPDIIKFIKDNIDSKGILGIDIAKDWHGKFYIIEENYAPEWEDFEKATGINVAEKIINLITDC